MNDELRYQSQARRAISGSSSSSRRSRSAVAPSHSSKLGEEQRLAALDRRLGDARALAVVPALEDGRHRVARLVAGEPGRGGADQALLEVDDLERAAAHVEQAPDLPDDLLERVPQPRRCLDHPRDPISTRYA